MKAGRTGRLASLAVALPVASLLVVSTTMLLLGSARHLKGLPVSVVVPSLYATPHLLIFGIVAVAILRRLPRHPVGWLFGWLAVDIGVNQFANAYAGWALPGTGWVLWIWNVSTGSTYFSLAMAFLLFPTGRPTSPRWRWLARLLWCYLGVMTLVGSVAPWPNPVALEDVQEQWILGWPEQNPLGWRGQGWLSDAYGLQAPLGVLLVVAAMLSLLPRWRRSTGDERQQVKWLGLAALLFTIELALGLSAFVTGSPSNPNDPLGDMAGQAIWTVVLAGIPVAIGLGIVRYRLYDIDVFISKTIVFGGLVFFIGLACVVGVVLVGEVVGRPGSSTLPALAATAVVATALQPLRTWLQARADRWVFGKRAAPYELMTRFGHELGEALGAPDVLARIAAAAAQAVRAKSARVTTALPNGEVLTACWPATTSPQRSGIVMPVHYNGAPIGEICVAGTEARTVDVALLRQVASVSAAALGNVRLLAELESLHDTIQRQNVELASSKRRLVAAAVAERQRLERLVARRIGPDLGMLRETLPALEGDVGSRPDEAAADCERLVAHVTRLVDEMRALSRGVLPPILADHGIVAALRATLRRLDIDVTMETDASIVGHRLPTHVETTAYLCCRAAVDAAAADRGAAPAALRLWRHDGALSFTVASNAHLAWDDDLAALRDRCRTLGGDLHIRADGPRYAITGSIPFHAGPDRDAARRVVGPASASARLGERFDHGAGLGSQGRGGARGGLAAGEGVDAAPAAGYVE